jgi:hypothetical protein
MILNKPYFKLISIYLMFSLVLLTLPAQGWAMFLPSGGAETSRQSDLAAIQKTLESTMVKQRLMDFGLTSEEAMAKINTLSDTQVHQFSTKLDAVQAGADGVGALIFLLLVAILVVVVLEATGHQIIIR